MKWRNPLKYRGGHIDEMISESRLRWFGCVYRRVINAPMRKSELIQVEGKKKGRGRPKITLLEQQQPRVQYFNVLWNIIKS